MAGKFELYMDKSGKFRFRLKASNGQVIATGEAYETKASALNGIESVKKNSAGASDGCRRFGRCQVLGSGSVDAGRGPVGCGGAQLDSAVQVLAL